MFLLLRLGLFVLTFFGLYGQHKEFSLSGRISNLDDSPVYLANISIGEGDGFYIAVTTDPLGLFKAKVPKGFFVFKIIYFGKEVYNKPIEVKGDLDLGNIQIDAAVTLKEVTLKAPEAYVEQKSDKIVFNLKGLDAVSSSNMFEVLGRTPGVIIDHNDNISIVGRGIASVMVDGKFLKIPVDQIKNYLSGLSAQEVSKIEVITSPSSKYEAQGGAGIINITTKKAKYNYINARYAVSYARYLLHEPGATFNYSKGKLNLLVSSNLTYGSKFNDNRFVVNYPDSSNKRQEFFIKNNSLMSNNRAAITYDFNENTSIGLEAIGLLARPGFNNRNTNAVIDGSGTKIDGDVTDNNSDKSSRLQNWSLSLNLKTKLGSNRRTIMDIGADYLNYDLNVNNILKIQSFSDNISSYKMFSKQNIYNYSFNIDFSSVFSSLVMEYGVKIFRNATDSKFDFFDGVSTLVKDFSKSDNFSYEENIQAAYVSANKSFGNKVTLKAGIRVENTNTNGNSQTTNINVGRSYLQAYPSISIQYLTEKKDAISINYTRRINRPSFSDFNPFRVYLSRDSYAEGNPFLQPAFINNLEVLYKHKSISLSPYFSIKTDNYGQIFETSKSNSNLIFNRKNFYDEYNYGISALYQTPITKRGMTVANVKAFGYSFKVYDNIPTTNSLNNGFAWLVYDRNIIYLNTSKTFSAEVTGMYLSSQYSGFSKLSAIYQIDAGLSYVLSKSWNISINAYDMFGSSYPTIDSNIGGSQQHIILGGYKARRFSFSANYNFSGKKAKKLDIESGNNDQKIRLNEN